MKLLYIKLDGTYKSLKNVDIWFSTERQGKSDPICFVGLNGTGKSNLIELIAEIFAFLDKLFLDYIPQNFKKTELNFIIEYQLWLDNEYKHIKIIKDKKHLHFYTIEDGEELEIVDNERERLLPKKIIGYTSGLNETLSIPFAEIETYYADEVAKQALSKSEQNTSIKIPRLIFMSYETNILIALTNSIFNENKWQKSFEDTLRIVTVESFRIVLQFKHKAAPKNGIKRTPELLKYEEWLKKCATFSDSNDEKEERIKLDYIIDNESRKAFKHFFGNAENFFMALYKLHRLNVLILGKEIRMLQQQQLRKENKLEKIPPPIPSDRVINIDDFKVRIKQPDESIYYIGISDGEHQFIQMFGTVMLFDNDNILYLFDEPETHYNPFWRVKFGDVLDEIIESEHQEFVISSHSPFILSGMHGYNVFKFRRNKDVIEYENINTETYGTSFETLLDEAFDLRPPIAEKPRKEIVDLINCNDIEKIESELNNYGDSIERFFLIQHLLRLKEQKKQNS